MMSLMRPKTALVLSEKRPSYCFSEAAASLAERAAEVSKGCYIYLACRQDSAATLAQLLISL